MQSNNSLGFGITILLAGCAGGGTAYDAAPRIDAPSTRALERPYDQPPREYSAPERAPEQAYAAAEPGTAEQVQGDYPPEPGAPSYENVPPSRAAPGTNYTRPGVRPAPTPSAPPARYQQRAALSTDAPPAVASSTGPRGTSGEQQRYDAVGYASWYGEEMGDAQTASGQRFDPNAMTAAHRTMPLGSIAEITALDTGRTILVLINDRGPGARDREIDLSRGAAQALGLTMPLAPVRVRLVTAAPQDASALRNGRAAGQRIDAPQSLLTALRRKLPARPAGMAATAPPRPIRQARGTDYIPPAAPSRDGARVTSGIFVQVAALSNEGRARALAISLDGRVAQAGSVYRVQIGPYANTAAAQRARDDVARRGYGDARIVTTN